MVPNTYRIISDSYYCAFNVYYLIDSSEQVCVVQILILILQIKNLKTYRAIQNLSMGIQLANSRD